MKRERITIRLGLVGSSDMERVKSYKASLEQAHKVFQELRKETAAISNMAVSQQPQIIIPKDHVLVRVSIWGKLVQVPYEIAKGAEYEYSL